MTAEYVQVSGAGDLSELLNGHSDEVCTIAGYPDREHFASGGHDRKIIVWDALSHAVLQTKQLERDIQSICINSSADLIAVGCVDGYWSVHEAAELNEIHHGRDGNEPIQCCEFSPGTRLRRNDASIYVCLCVCVCRRVPSGHWVER